MKEKKRLYIFLGIIGVIVIAAIVISFINSDASTSSKDYVSKVENLIESKDREVIYLGRPTCSYCSMTTPVLNYLKSEYGVDYNYINTDEITTSDLKKILANFDIDYENFGTPTIVIVENGKVIDINEGYSEEEEHFFTFFKENGLIDEDAEYVERPKDTEDYYNDLSYDEYEELIDSDEKGLVVIIQTGCGYCEKEKEVFKQIYDNLGYKVNTLNLTNLSSDERTKLLESLDYYNENEWGTPLTLVVKNNEVEDYLGGYTEYDSYVKFLENNSFIGD